MTRRPNWEPIEDEFAEEPVEGDILDAVVMFAPPELIPKVLGKLEETKALLLKKLVSGNGHRPSGKPLLDVKDVAERFRVKESHIYELARSGSLKSTKIGRYIRFTEEEVKRYIDTHGPPKVL